MLNRWKITYICNTLQDYTSVHCNQLSFYGPANVSLSPTQLSWFCGLSLPYKSLKKEREQDFTITSVIFIHTLKIMAWIIKTYSIWLVCTLILNNYTDHYSVTKFTYSGVLAISVDRKSICSLIYKHYSVNFYCLFTRM